MNYPDRRSITLEIIETGRRLWQRSYVAANDGNISVRLREQEFLTTTTGVSKGFMKEDDIVLVDQDGNSLDDGRKPSSELPMHLEIYRRRPDINAIVHAHPPTATGFAAAGLEMDRSILPEVILTLGTIALTPYGTTGTDELAEIVGKGILNNNGLLLQNHGAVTVGESLSQAYFRMETMEHFANITLVTRILGRQSVLGEDEIKRLMHMGSGGYEKQENNSKESTGKDEKFLISRDELIALVKKIISETESY